MCLLYKNMAYGKTCLYNILCNLLGDRWWDQLPGSMAAGSIRQWSDEEMLPLVEEPPDPRREARRCSRLQQESMA